MSLFNPVRMAKVADDLYKTNFEICDKVLCYYPKVSPKHKYCKAHANEDRHLIKSSYKRGYRKK